MPRGTKKHKYIVVKVDDRQGMFIFPSEINHDEYMSCIRYASETGEFPLFDKIEPVSAGFIENGYASGKSETLGLDSRVSVDSAMLHWKDRWHDYVVLTSPQLEGEHLFLFPIWLDKKSILEECIQRAKVGYRNWYRPFHDLTIVSQGRYMDGDVYPAFPDVEPKNRGRKDVAILFCDETEDSGEKTSSSTSMEKSKTDSAG